jgi:hypothetical protein
MILHDLEHPVQGKNYKTFRNINKKNCSTEVILKILYDLLHPVQGI